MNADSTDILIVGGGFSGLMAAVFAARAGCSVRVLSRGEGALSIGGGSVDVLGAAPGHASLLRKPFDGFAALSKEHPYSLAGQKVVSEALGAFLEVCAGHNVPYALAGDVLAPVNTFLPTSAGTVKPACLVTDLMDGLDDASNVLVVGIEGLKDFFPRLAAQGLERQPLFQGKRFVPVTLSCPAEFSVSAREVPCVRCRDLSTLDFARFLDKPGGLAWFADRIRSLPLFREMRGRGVIALVPPVLGASPDGVVRRELARALAMPVHELVAPPPSMTGLRLREMLLRELRLHGVELVPNADVCRVESENGALTAFVTGDGVCRWRARAFILATGGIYGGGLLVRPDRVEDAILGPEAALAPDLNPLMEGWAAPEAFPSPGAPGHGFARVGLRVNGAFQPLSRNGGVLFSNLFAAGRAVGGYDPATEKSGNGVALTTAFAASRGASCLARG